MRAGILRGEEVLKPLSQFFSHSMLQASLFAKTFLKVSVYQALTSTTFHAEGSLIAAFSLNRKEKSVFLTAAQKKDGSDTLFGKLWGHSLP